ncbi:MAG: zinc-ribbon domain-containing protein [Pseudomonadota bacterium]
MKIQCPNCKAVYNVDISKIPEVPAKGAFATCRKCKERMPIAPMKEESKTQPEEHREEIIPCPKCGHVNVSTDSCVNCGTDFTPEEKEKIKIVLDIKD